MAPLNGITLGEKHRYYNQLLNETIAKGPADIQKINYDEDDIDNMLRIDIACKERNVEYIFEVLKCDDMLYVSRALKRSVWLITEQEYAHLINPEYLRSNLFLEMTPKAIRKLMLYIRLHLKDEKRVEDFFISNDTPNVIKWLENCSLPFIDETITLNPNTIPKTILKRLFRKSINLFATYVNNFDNCYGRINCYDVLFFLKNHTLEFLTIIESIPSWKCNFPDFNKKRTQILMRRCFDRIIQKFNCYKNHIDLSIFVKFLKINNVNIESFLLANYEKNWLRFGNLKPFLQEIPQEDNINILKKLCDMKNNESIDDRDADSSQDSEDSDGISNHSNSERTEIEELFFKIEVDNETFSNVYRWYEFVSFEKAFHDLQKIIYAESSPDERQQMLTVLLKSARKDMVLVRKVLKYYHDRHINESYIQKIKFINSLLSLHNAYRFDDTTWNILNELFHSLEVYIESTNKVQQCLDTIILYKVINNQPVHGIVEQKFTFNTFKDVHMTLNLDEREKLFNYLYDQLVSKLHAQDIDRETELKQAVELMQNLWTLLKDFKRESTHRPFDIDNIIVLSNANKQCSLNVDMRCLYRLVRPYQRQMVENSLLLCPCEEVCIQALKHDPGLLVRYESEVAALYNKVPLRKFLSKLKIYWPDTLAREWNIKCFNNLTNINNHKASISGIIILSPRISLIDFIKKYVPKEDKIKWSEDNKIEISLQMHIAASMFLARPQLPTELVLLYAKQDYLKHAMYSVYAIYHNLRSNDIKKNILLLISAPVTVQKHGIRLARALMSIEEQLEAFTSIWKSTGDISIRTIIFQTVFGFFGNAGNSLVLDIWKVLSLMIDDLNYEENKDIYKTLGNVNQIPTRIISEYYKKCYIILRDIPPTLGLEKLHKNILTYCTDVIHYLDLEFVENTILLPVYDIFTQKNTAINQILSAYLLCSNDKKKQLEKYNRLFNPMFDLCVPEWKKHKFQPNIVASFKDLLSNITKDMPRFVFELKMVIPVQIVTTIQSRLELKLCKQQMYSVITRWNLSAAYIELLNDMLIEHPDKYKNWVTTRYKSINAFSKICLKYLKEDIEINFPSIHMLFGDALKCTCKDFGIETDNFLRLLNGMLISEDEQVYIFVLSMMPKCDETWILEVICRKLYRFPSKELRMHYNAKYRKKYNTEESESEYEVDTESDFEQDQVSGNDESGSGYESSESEEFSDDDVNVAPIVNNKWRCSIF